ncbi:MAG: hypothetical protein ACRCU0_03615 [Candidatus Rhabdochlamydia sp.]
MSDIPITASSEKVIQPIAPVKQQQKTIEEPQMEENPYTGSTEPINPEHLMQIKKDLANLHVEQPKTHASALKEFSKKDLEQIKKELANLSPKQLQDLVNQLKSNLSELQATLTELKKQKKIDPEKADLILDTISNLSSKDLQNLSKEDQEQLSNTLDALKEKVTDLINNKQVEPEIGNVLILFLAFAKAQMDQNDKAMLAGIQQTKVKTTQLELQAEKQKGIAGQSTQGQHLSSTKALCIGLGVFAACLALTGIGVLLAGAVLGVAATLAVVGGSALVALVGVGTPAIVAVVNPDAPGLGGLTEEGPRQTLVDRMQAMLSYCSTQTQKLSSQLGSTEKMFVENVSDRSTQLGQQAGQAITEMGEIMKSR